MRPRELLDATRLGMYKRRMDEFAKIQPQHGYVKDFRFITTPDASYTFRGKPNLELIALECAREGKVGFVAIGKETAYFGVKRGYIDKFPMETVFLHVYDGFTICSINKTCIGMAITAIRDVRKKYDKRYRKITRKLRKARDRGDFSNKPATTVKTF